MYQIIDPSLTCAHFQSSLKWLLPALCHFHLKVLIPNQKSFISARQANLVTFTSTVFRILCKQGLLDGVYFHLGKAFDLVDHTILLPKLSHYGVCGQVLEWFNCYLPDRKGFGRVNHKNPTTYRKNQGIRVLIKFSAIFYIC